LARVVVVYPGCHRCRRATRRSASLGTRGHEAGFPCGGAKPCCDFVPACWENEIQPTARQTLVPADPPRS